LERKLGGSKEQGTGKYEREGKTKVRSGKLTLKK